MPVYIEVLHHRFALLPPLIKPGRVDPPLTRRPLSASLPRRQREPGLFEFGGQTVDRPLLADFTVLNGIIPVSAITIPTVTVDLPTVVGAIGTANTSIPATFTAAVNPFQITLLNLGGPGLFNASGAVSSGWFNSGTGGSGVFNTGTGVSGWWNAAPQSLLRGAGLSGMFNQGSLGSGSVNVGSGVSGRYTTGTLSPGLPSWVSGLANTGTQLAGVLQGALPVSDYISRVLAALDTPIPLTTNQIDISDILIGYILDIPLDIPVDATFTEPIVVPVVDVPTVTIGPGPRIQAAFVTEALSGPTPAQNPCGSLIGGNLGACVVLELDPKFSAGGGVGPITISPGGVLTPSGQQVLSLNIGGIGNGITTAGTAGVGPIRILLPQSGRPTTVEQFPYAVGGVVDIDVPITADIGVTVSQFSEEEFVTGLLGYKFGYCVLVACSPVGLNSFPSGTALRNQCGGQDPVVTCYVTNFIFGRPRQQNPGYPPGSFPPDAVLTLGTSPLINNSGGGTTDGQTFNFVVNAGVEASVPFQQSGTLGPFPSSGG